MNPLFETKSRIQKYYRVRPRLFFAIVTKRTDKLKFLIRVKIKLRT